MNLHGSIMLSKLKLETYMFMIGEWINKLFMAYSYNILLLSNKKGKLLRHACISKTLLGQKKSDIKKYTL